MFNSEGGFKCYSNVSSNFPTIFHLNSIGLFQMGGALSEGLNLGLSAVLPRKSALFL